MAARPEARQVFRILDLEGNQAVDTLFYRSDDPEERYSAQDTIRAQRNLYLSAGSVLLSSRATDGDDRRRYLRPSRHARRRVRGRGNRALCA